MISIDKDIAQQVDFAAFTGNNAGVLQVETTISSTLGPWFTVPIRLFGAAACKSLFSLCRIGQIEGQTLRYPAGLPIHCISCDRISLPERPTDTP